MKSRDKKSGFTMVELMMAMATASIVMAAIFTTYQVQVRGKRSQELMTDMQQGGRAALTIMEKEIRMAGCDPEGSANAGVVIGNSAEMGFTMDICDSAGVPGANGLIDNGNEDVRYALSNDEDGDGIADGFPCNLGREIGGLTGAGNGLQPICENVEALNFVYMDRNDQPLDPVSNPNDRARIRYVEIIMVLRSGERIMGTGETFVNRTEYRNRRGDVILPPQNDDITRLMLSTIVLCRNIDLDVTLN